MLRGRSAFSAGAGMAEGTAKVLAKRILRGAFPRGQILKAPEARRGPLNRAKRDFAGWQGRDSALKFGPQKEACGRSRKKSRPRWAPLNRAKRKYVGWALGRKKEPRRGRHGKNTASSEERPSAYKTKKTPGACLTPRKKPLPPRFWRALPTAGNMRYNKVQNHSKSQVLPAVCGRPDRGLAWISRRWRCARARRPTP